jgi:hypothetical protein
MGVGFHRAEIVDADDVDVSAARFDNGAQTLRPIRPKPLIATLVTIVFSRIWSQLRPCAYSKATISNRFKGKMNAKKIPAAC